jgi:hypothetical protein
LGLGITTTTAGLCIYYWPRKISIGLLIYAPWPEYPIVIIITIANEAQALSGFLLELDKLRMCEITHYQIDA